MTLKTRVMATVLWNGEAVVKGRGFSADRVVGTPRQVLRVFAARDVDELVFLDVRRGARPDLALIEQLASDASFPLAIGGGIHSVDDARAVIRAGADKVVLTLVSYPIQECAQALGSQAVVVSVDHGSSPGPRGQCVSVCRCPQWSAAAELSGAGEILLQSVDRDGTMNGYDLDLIRAVTAAVSIPVIASGGCSGPADMREAIRAGASAAAAGALFAFTETTPATSRRNLRQHGVVVRS